MSTSDIIATAIQQRKPIVFEYIKPEEPRGQRIGNPHALYNSVSKASLGQVKVDIYQEEGVTKNNDPLPHWFQFFIENMQNVSILESKNDFQIAPGYNPYSQNYRELIVKV